MSRLVLAVGALVALTLTLSGCGDSGGNTPPAKKVPNIGGFYTSPNFSPNSGNFAGLYVISDRQADELSQQLHIVGSDDGKSFWNVEGNWTDKASGAFTAFFSHRADGMPDLNGVLSDAGIAWDNSEDWAPLKTPSFGLKMQPEILAQDKVGGFYVDPVVHLHPQLFVGARMIADNYFPKITMIGTDDGSTFWSIIGRWDGISRFHADFTPIGGSNTTGKLDASAILWEGDGRYWQKELAVSDGGAITV